MQVRFLKNSLILLSLQLISACFVSAQGHGSTASEVKKINHTPYSLGKLIEWKPSSLSVVMVAKAPNSLLVREIN